ncbi:MAG: nucleotidyltransferase domain-containing protein [Sarcina sp.]
MNKTVKEYQRAYNELVQDLNDNPNILGVTVFGSIITGDIWKNSDIDMFVILDERGDIDKDLFGIKCGIDIHMIILSKEEFLNFRDNFTGGSKLHRKLMSSKLVFGKDNEIIDSYNFYKFLHDIDKDRWNLSYLGDLIRAIGLCDKALSNDKIYNAIYNALKLGESFSKIYLNVNGYMLSSDPLTMTINLDDEFKKYMDRVIADPEVESIRGLINYIEDYLNANIEKISKLLLNVLKKAKIPLTINEIKLQKEFFNTPIEFNKILKDLESRNIIKKSVRVKTTNSNEKIIEELVYYYE